MQNRNSLIRQAPVRPGTTVREARPPCSFDLPGRSCDGAHLRIGAFFESI